MHKLSRVFSSAKLYFVKKKLILVLLFVVVLVIFGVLYFAGVFRPKGAGLVIHTDQPATVYVNSEQVGTTPYEQVLDPADIEIKLVPQSFEKPLAPYETKVVLQSGIQTIVEREFAETSEGSSGEIISFEKGPKDESSVVVISDPGGAQVEIDGVVKGFTSYKSLEISEGLHNVKVGANGYNERYTQINTQKGYKLTLFVKLSKIPKVEVEMNEESEPDAFVRVEIVETPTGFLRVRDEASTDSVEVGRVEPGQDYDVLEQSEDGKWVKIRTEEDTEGWVSKEYTKEVDSEPDEQVEE